MCTLSTGGHLGAHLLPSPTHVIRLCHPLANPHDNTDIVRSLYLSGVIRKLSREKHDKQQLSEMSMVGGVGAEGARAVLS